MPTNAEAIARILRDRGVEYLFGLPGGEIVAFIDACRRAGIRFLLTGHEASAAWIAQVLGQITGIPGVCCATLGPGATNLATGIANAYLDRAPLLAVTAQIPKTSFATMTHQRLDLKGLFSPITKASLPFDQIGPALDAATQPAGSPAPCSARNPPIAPIAPVSAALDHAQRPLILIGLGATPASAPAIRSLIDRLQAPFLVTPKVKGIVPEDHPLFLGVASGMTIDRDILETIAAADLVLAIGFDPVECDKTWFAKTNIVSIDSASMAEGGYKPAESIGEITALISQLEVAPKPWPADL